MKYEEIKQLDEKELQSRVRQWRDELFRARVRSHTSELKDTSVFGKLRKDIARALTALNAKKTPAQDQPIAKPKDPQAAKAEVTNES